MRPLSYFIPKVLLPVRGRPVLDHLLDCMARAGVEHHYVVASEHGETITNYIERAHIPNVTVVPALGWETGGDLALALEEIDPASDALVLNGDIITDIDTSKLVEFHRRVRPMVTMGLLRIDDPEEARRFGQVQVDASGRVARFSEKPEQTPPRACLVNAGFYVFDRRLLREERERFLRPHRFRLERDLYPKLADSGDLFAIDVQPSYWWDVGTLDSYLKAEQFLVGGDRVIPP